MTHPQLGRPAEFLAAGSDQESARLNDLLRLAAEAGVPDFSGIRPSFACHSVCALRLTRPRALDSTSARAGIHTGPRVTPKGVADDEFFRRKAPIRRLACLAPLRASRRGRRRLRPFPGYLPKSAPGSRRNSVQLYLLWRAVDEHGAELDILLQKRRDKAAAKRFFQRVLAACPAPPAGCSICPGRASRQRLRRWKYPVSSR